MSRRYSQKPVVTGVTRFTKAPMSEVEFSRMTANPIHSTTFNAGTIIPIYYAEILPHDTFNMSCDFVIRQTTALYPTMDNMECDIYAYFVPNRIINDSWKNVQGENTSGIWSAPEVDLAPLVRGNFPSSSVRVPVGSVADYYGFPTQADIPVNVLQAMNDLKFRGYLEIYNNYFRDENYQNPISYSKLNVYNGFFESGGSRVPLGEGSIGGILTMPLNQKADGSYGAGAIQKAIYGDGSSVGVYGTDTSISPMLTSWSALMPPLKANKLHDFITSGLPSPQKGAEVYFGIGDLAPLTVGNMYSFPIDASGDPVEMLLSVAGGLTVGPTSAYPLVGRGVGSSTLGVQIGDTSVTGTRTPIAGTNVYADLSQVTGLSVNDLRTAVATQQVYEVLARGGSRYLETIRSFFDIETENPFSDIPTELGHIRRGLDLYQVAQTSASETGNTPQGELAAFGYTSTGGNLFNRTFLEHGYIHIFAVVRHRNTYSTYLAPDNFRKGTLDFYLPQLANIGEQPIRKATLNPFSQDSLEKVIAYQEAWWELRYEPNRVSGLMRPGVTGSLANWNYADPLDTNFEVVTGDWLKSNSKEVLDRTLAVTSDLAPQFKGLFSFKVDKQRPLPTYSVPGLDIV